MPKINWIQPKYDVLTLPFICLIAWMGFTPAHASNVTAPAAAQASSPTIELTGPQTPSREGYFTLTIATENDDSQRFVLERSGDHSFDSTVQYPLLGDARTITLSGFADGDYYFRARARGSDEGANNSYSNTLKVTVQHYPLWQALTLFTFGAALLIWLLVWLLLCNRQVQRSAQ